MENENKCQRQITYQEREEIEEKNNHFFSPKEGLVYTLTFSSAQLFEKEVTYKDKQKNEDVKEKKVVLDLHIDSINGEYVDKVWEVKAKKFITAQQLAYESGNLTKRTYKLKRTGSDLQTIYEMIDIGAKNGSGQ